MKKILFLTLTMCLLLCVNVCAIPSASGDFEAFTDALGTTPDDNVTASCLVTAAVRLHSLYNDGNITANSDTDECFEYALKNGIVDEDFFDGDYDSYDVTRAELAYVLGKTLPSDNGFDALNEVLSMPDCDASSEYYPYALLLVKSGIIEGTDEYASFAPSKNVKNYELSDILSRIVHPENRIQKDYIEYASDEPFYLIDDYLMGDTTSVGGIYNIASGWRYDYTGSSAKARNDISGSDDARNGYVNTLRDLSSEDNITISREIFPQKDGELVLETSFHVTFGFAGFRLYFEDIDENEIFELGTYSSGLYFCNDAYYNGSARKTRYLSYPYSGTYKYDRKYYLYADPWRSSDDRDSIYRLSDQIIARLTINLDKGTVNVKISGTDYGTYNLRSGYNGIKKIAFSTGVEEKIEYTVKQVHLYKNYRVNDKFRVDKVSSKPTGYTTSGTVTVKEMLANADNQGDFYSVYVEGKKDKTSYAKKSFSDIGGIVQLESYILLPDGNDGAYFKVGCDNADVLNIVTKDNKFYVANADGSCGTYLRNFTSNVWQCIRIEADTNTQTALIKIDGKVVATDVPFLVKTNVFNSLEIGISPSEDCVMWFDDVEVHELFDNLEDYVPEPVPLDTGDYILSMSVCNLWRNGSHYGWEYINPHSEIEPITGFYDEGIAEAMDWEIKFLSEHGIKTYAMCWYAPQAPMSVPMKKPRMIDAHHEGYFNARYTEYLDFSIMWENANYGTPGMAEAFKENIFPFWMEWYFSDDRYFRIEEDGKEKLLLTVYQWSYFRNMCLPAKKGATSSTIDSYYSKEELDKALEDANELIKWMEQQVIDAGYADGINLCFTNNGYDKDSNDGMVKMAGTDTAIFPYTWGNTAYDLDAQISQIERCYQQAQKSNLDLLAMAGVGFNNVAWAQTRYPLMNDDDFEKLLVWLKDDYMPRYKNNKNKWKQNFIQFDTWNEYGEGHYMYPTVGLEKIDGTSYGGYGSYGYLEAIAKVFGGNNYDEDEHALLDITPSDLQKSRIRHLYVGNRTIIRRQFFPTTNGGADGNMMETPVPETAILKYDFTKNTNGLLYFSGFSSFSIPNSAQIAMGKEKVLQGTTNNNDPIVNIKIPDGIETADIDVIHIKMSLSSAGTYGQVFFQTTTMPKDSQGKTSYSEDYRYNFNIPLTGTQDYYIDVKTHSGFTGTLTALRLDTGNFADNFVKLYTVEFLKFSNEQQRTAISVDGIAYTMTDYWEIQDQSRNEIYIAPTDENGLYKMLHIVYDWNAKTGELSLDTPNGTTFDFAVGSDVVTVNSSKQMKLARKFSLYDGAPVLPLLFILDNAEYNYNYDYSGSSKSLSITVSDSVKYMEIANGKAQDTNSSDAFFSLSESTVSIVKDPQYEQNNVWSVGGKQKQKSYLATNASFEADTEYIVAFDINPTSLVGTSLMGSDYDVYLELIYSDGTENTSHVQKIANVVSGTWTHVEKTLKVSSERVENTDVVEMIGIYISPDSGYGVNYYADNFSVRGVSKPFKVLNGDGEDENMDMWYSSNAIITREDDGLGEGNHVIKVAYDKENYSKWTYLRQETQFEKGATYYYSFDFKMGENEQGDDTILATFALNARYYDLLQQHFTVNQNDHSYTERNEISSKDGWKHYTGSFTISQGYVPKSEGGMQDEITFYVNPKTVDGAYSAMTFYVDNFHVSTTPLD